MQPSGIITHSVGRGVTAAAFESQMLLSITLVHSLARSLFFVTGTPSGVNFSSCFYEKSQSIAAGSLLGCLCTGCLSLC